MPPIPAVGRHLADRRYSGDEVAPERREIGRAGVAAGDADHGDVVVRSRGDPRHDGDGGHQVGAGVTVVGRSGCGARSSIAGSNRGGTGRYGGGKLVGLVSEQSVREPLDGHLLEQECRRQCPQIAAQTGDDLAADDRVNAELLERAAVVELMLVEPQHLGEHAADVGGGVRRANRRGGLGDAEVSEPFGRGFNDEHLLHAEDPLERLECDFGLERADAGGGEQAAVVGVGNSTDAAPVAPVDDGRRHASAAELPRVGVLERASGGVVRLPRAVDQRRRRREEHEEVERLADQCAVEVHRSGELDPEHIVEIGPRHVRQHAIAQHGRAVDGAVDHPEATPGLGDSSRQLRRVGRIRPEVESVAAALRHRSDPVPDLGVLDAPADPGHVRPVSPREVTAQREADPAGTAEQDIGAAFAELRARTQRQGHRRDPAYQPPRATHRDQAHGAVLCNDPVRGIFEVGAAAPELTEVAKIDHARAPLRVLGGNAAREADQRRGVRLRRFVGRGRDRAACHDLQRQRRTVSPGSDEFLDDAEQYRDVACGRCIRVSRCHEADSVERLTEIRQILGAVVAVWHEHCLGGRHRSAQRPGERCHRWRVDHGGPRNRGRRRGRPLRGPPHRYEDLGLDPQHWPRHRPQHEPRDSDKHQPRRVGHVDIELFAGSTMDDSVHGTGERGVNVERAAPGRDERGRVFSVYEHGHGLQRAVEHGGGHRGRRGHWRRECCEGLVLADGDRAQQPE